MIRIPPKKQFEKQAPKPAKTSLPLPKKYSKNFRQSPSPTKRQSSSEFPIRDRKVKGKAKSLSDEDKEIKELINDTMSQIFGALKFEDTPKGLIMSSIELLMVTIGLKNHQLLLMNKIGFRA